MIQKQMRGLAVLTMAVSMAASSHAWVQWSGNGHWYDVVLISGNDHSWSAARASAQGLMAPNGAMGDLATITSVDENTFAFNLANSAQFWQIDSAGNNEGPYLGGFQTNTSGEPGGNWAWVSGEAWSYTNWANGEPNNFGGAENWACFFTQGGGRASTWNDLGDSPASVTRAYMVEAVPEPVTMLALAPALLMLKRRRK